MCSMPARLGAKPPAVKLAHVSLQHARGTLALEDVCFKVEPGEFVFLIGQTGSGKSSLLKILNRELKPTGGEVWVDGIEVTSLHRRGVPSLRRKLGVVFQDFRLLPDRTLFENVSFALRVIGVHGKPLNQRTIEALDRVGILPRARMFPHQVSGGEQQRAALARAIVNRPQLLLADEPTGNLDPETSRGIMDLLLEINRSGTTMLIATHDQPLVDAVGRRVLELQGGRLVRDEAQGGYDSAEIQQDTEELHPATGGSGAVKGSESG